MYARMPSRLHFQAIYSRASDERFIVPLPRKTDAKTLGESRSQAVRRFVGLERSLRAKSQFDDVDAVIQEYIELGHAELVPELDLHKPTSEVFYLPIHVVRKESSSTTKIRAVFDASAKSSSGISLNDTFLVGPTVHPTHVYCRQSKSLQFVTYRCLCMCQGIPDVPWISCRRQSCSPIFLCG